MKKKYPNEVCTGFIGMNRKALDSLDLDNAPRGMEFSSWLLLELKKKPVISVVRDS